MPFDRPSRIFLLRNDVLVHYKKVPITCYVYEPEVFSVNVYVVHCMYLCDMKEGKRTIGLRTKNEREMRN